MEKLGKLWLGICGLLLIFQFGVQVYLAQHDSQTTDEAIHLVSGYTYLTKGDFRFNPEHPPLVKMLAAVPLLFIKPNLPTDQYLWDDAGDYFYDSWRENRTYGELFMYGLGNNPDQLIFWGRFPIIILTFGLGLFIAFLAWKYFGPLGALLSTALYVFDPNIAAHGHLVTTDIGVSFGVLFALYRAYLFVQKPILKNVLYLGLAFGLAILSKFTAIIFLLILAVLLILAIVTKRLEIKSTLKWALVFVVTVFVVIAMGYLFRLAPAPTSSSITSSILVANNTKQIGQLSLSDNVYSVARHLVIPRDFYKGLTMLITHVGGGHDAFLLGNFSKTGWWYYFPVVFSAKTMLATLLSLGALIYLAVTRRLKNEFAVVVFCTAVLYLLASMASRANLGVRHIMPFYILMYTAVGVLPLVIWRQNFKAQLIALIAVISLLALEFGLVAPHFISYYNIFYGGTANGNMIANDSNYDWGQDLKRIRDYVAKHNLTDYYLEYSWDGASSLDYYGLSRLTASDMATRRHGTIIIGATALSSKDNAWIRQGQLVERITPSVFVYEIK